VFDDWEALEGVAKEEGELDKGDMEGLCGG